MSHLISWYRNLFMFVVCIHTHIITYIYINILPCSLSHTGPKRNIVGFVNIATTIVRLLILSFYHIPLPGITSSWITSRLPRCVPFWSPPFCSCGVSIRHWDPFLDGWWLTTHLTHVDQSWDPTGSYRKNGIQHTKITGLVCWGKS